MRILIKTKQFHDVLKDKKIKEISTVQIYEHNRNTYLRVNEEFYDTQEVTESLFQKLLINGYADLRNYKKVQITMGY